MARKRKNGEGTIRLRKDGRWEGRVVIGYDEKGYPKTKNVTAKTKTECAAKLEKLKEECGPLRSGKVKAERPFGEWIEFWYQHFCKQRIRKNTQLAYEGNIRNHIVPVLGKIPLNKLTQKDLQRFYVGLKPTAEKKGLSDQNIRGCHMVCHAALEKAMEEKLIRSNPTEGCKLPPKKAHEMQVLTREEMQRFLIQAKAEGWFEFFLLELSTGMRIGEITALQWDDLNMETGELHIERQAQRLEGKLVVSTPKTKSSIRTVVLPPLVLAVLKAYRETVDSRWIFPSPVHEDEPISTGVCRERMHLILEHAQCKQVRFHDLRHTFSTTALEHGMDIKTLSAVLGHVTASTTLDVYAHVTDTMQKQAAVNIDRGIGGVSPCESSLTTEEGVSQPQNEKPPAAPFTPRQGKHRRPGTGCITQISENCWEGRYSPIWPDGKKHSRNVYAKTREECEEQLKELIVQMKAEIAAVKNGGMDAPKRGSKLRMKIKEYMIEHPEATNKSQIAREVGTDRGTVAKYYEAIRKEMKRGY